MPNFDGGHYFLTVFAPIRTGVVEQDGASQQSHERLLRATLANIATAQQTDICAKSGKNSPFAKNKRTHLARFAVLDDVTYNGRLAKGGSSIIPQHVDRLSCPYLLFAAEFDAATADKTELDSYLSELWLTMEPELRSIFQHCVGFQNVTDSGSFIYYIKQCQIETTMPFNDYWRGAPPLKDLQVGSIPLWIAVACIGALVGFLAPWIIDYFADSIGFWTLLSSVVLTIVLGLGPVSLKLLSLYLAVMRVGNKPYPTAPDSDLKSILKSLYLQQNFTVFAIQNQGVNDVDLHKNFGAFLEKHKPGDLDNPTQQPGVISFSYGAKP